MLITDLKGNPLRVKEEIPLTDYNLTLRLKGIIENFPSVITHLYEDGPDRITMFLVNNGYLDEIPRVTEKDNYEYVINSKGLQKFEEMKDAHPEWFTERR